MIASQEAFPTAILIDVPANFVGRGNEPDCWSCDGPSAPPKITKIEPWAMPKPAWSEVAKLAEFAMDSTQGVWADATLVLTNAMIEDAIRRDFGI